MAELTVENLLERMETVKKVALMAGDIQKQNFQQGVRIEVKSTSIDLVTEIDRRCDAAIQEALATVYPNDLFLTEETFQEDQAINLSNTWVIDPIDGTTNFAHGYPYFCVSIAYLVDAKPVLGLIYNPIFNEMFWAIRGQGAFLNARRLRVSQVSSLDQALMCTGFPYECLKENMTYFENFMNRCHGVRRMGSAALDLAYVARSSLDGFWEPRLSPWDVAAGVLLVEEAGGKVTDFTGKPLALDTRRIYIVASNNQAGLHQEIVDICSQSATPLTAVG